MENTSLSTAESEFFPDWKEFLQKCALETRAPVIGKWFGIEAIKRCLDVRDGGNVVTQLGLSGKKFPIAGTLYNSRELYDKLFEVEHGETKKGQTRKRRRKPPS